MKRIHLVSLLFASIFMSSCNNGEIKTLNEKVDSLTEANIRLQNELDCYKLNPKKVLVDIEQNYADKDYSKLDSNLNLLKQYHPDSPALEAAKKIQDQAIKDQEAESEYYKRKVAEARKKRDKED